MKAIMFLLAFIFLTACNLTGSAIGEIEQTTLLEKDKDSLEAALKEKDVSYCYAIQTQPIKEECLMQLAKDLQDPTICNNLLGSLRRSCKDQISG